MQFYGEELDGSYDNIRQVLFLTISVVLQNAILIQSVIVVLRIAMQSIPLIVAGWDSFTEILRVTLKITSHNAIDRSTLFKYLPA